jgi:hypothetical protein
VEIVGGEEEGISALPKPEQGHRPHQDGRLLRRVDGNPRQQQVAIDKKQFKKPICILLISSSFAKTFLLILKLVKSTSSHSVSLI